METKYTNPHAMMERGVRRTPWKLGEDETTVEDSCGVVVADTCQPENDPVAIAAFIVRAVNSHQALVDMISEFHKIVSLHPEMYRFGLLSQINDALKLARGE